MSDDPITVEGLAAQASHLAELRTFALLREIDTLRAKIKVLEDALLRAGSENDLLRHEAEKRDGY